MVSLFIGSIIGLIFLIVQFKLMTEEFAFQVSKILIQFITVIIIGQIIHLFINAYTKKKQEEAVLREYRNSILKKISTLNTSALRFIHNIRSNAIFYDETNAAESGARIKLQVYKYEMQNFNELLFEIYITREEIKTFRHAFSDITNFWKSIRKVETILLSITKEFEKVSVRIDKDDESLPLTNLPKLQDFIKPFGKSNQRQIFSDLYDEIMASIRDDNQKTMKKKKTSLKQRKLFHS